MVYKDEVKTKFTVYSTIYCWLHLVIVFKMVDYHHSSFLWFESCCVPSGWWKLIRCIHPFFFLFWSCMSDQTHSWWITNPCVSNCYLKSSSSPLWHFLSRMWFSSFYWGWHICVSCLIFGRTCCHWLIFYDVHWPT